MSAGDRIEQLEARVSTVGADLEYQIAGLREALGACVRVIVASYMADGMPVPAALRDFQHAEADKEIARIMAARPGRHLSAVKS